MDLSQLGKRIQDLRQARNWGTHELSMASGVPVPTIHRIENGTIKNPGIDKVVAIARALSVTVSDLLGEAPTDDAEAREVLRLVTQIKHDNQVGFIANLALATRDQIAALDSVLQTYPEVRRD